ncbi:MAG: 4Fe-4S dicluster domain-containing protein [Bacteroidetes bacterium]|nr:4Fe-4S dicluster domain-containing protein [Bacteroidota bacterium]
MLKQIIFIIALLITLGVFTYTLLNLIALFKLTKPFPIKDFGKRFSMMLTVAFGQTKIFRKPVIGLMHALVFWGFCVIIVGSIEMVIDGVFGLEKSLGFLGVLYDVIFASGDIFALLIFVFILLFIGRRAFLNIKRFTGIELTHKNHLDAYIALSIIFLLMFSLLGMNTFYVLSTSAGDLKGIYPVSSAIADLIGRGEEDADFYQAFWWMHILLIFAFANILPYSKHFHVFLSVPNVFLSRLEPLGKLYNMDNITREVKMMMNPETAFAASDGNAAPERFGVKDAEDVNWKNYFDALSCTQCGRCTAVCPANITGKKLSPRKLMMDLRARMKEKGPFLVKDKAFNDNKSLNVDYFSAEEIWACTTCNACAKECPININHPSLIVDMRRYLVMEEGSAPSGIKAAFTNVENNGAPWQFSPEDRLLWAKNM